MTRTITEVYFSPGGTTRKVAAIFSTAFADKVESINLLEQPVSSKQFIAGETAVFALPVFSGRIPAFCVDLLNKFKGKNTPAVAIVVYGNRAYEDALLELCDLLQDNGFIVYGAGAFIARHSIFPAVATGHPDEKDIKQIAEFARLCSDKLALSEQLSTVTVAGKYPYREIKRVPLRPVANSSCVRCKACVKVCPAGAISADAPHRTDKHKCIACTACIYQCPHQARELRGLLYTIARWSFVKKYRSLQLP